MICKEVLRAEGKSYPRTCPVHGLGPCVPTLPEIVELKLCEQDRIILRPDVLYRFSVDENCAECRRLRDAGSLIRGVSPTE